MTDSELLQAIYNDTQELKQKVSGLESDMSNLKSDMQDVKQDVKDIKLTLENEIRVNIQRVAEGHLDLSRDLKEAKKTNNEFEMLAVRVNILESDVRKLKEKIS